VHCACRGKVVEPGDHGAVVFRVPAVEDDGMPMLILLLVFLLPDCARSEEVLVDTVFSPVATGRSDEEILALEARVSAWIGAVMPPERIQVVAGPALTPQRRVEVRWRLDCAIIEGEHLDRSTTIRVLVFDTHGHRRPLRPHWSGSIERSGALETAGHDVQALLRAALAALPAVPE
jgi:hypothetical protein